MRGFDSNYEKPHQMIGRFDEVTGATIWQCRDCPRRKLVSADGRHTTITAGEFEPIHVAQMGEALVMGTQEARQ